MNTSKTYKIPLVHSCNNINYVLINLKHNITNCPFCGINKVDKNHINSHLLNHKNDKLKILCKMGVTSVKLNSNVYDDTVYMSIRIKKIKDYICPFSNNYNYSIKCIGRFHTNQKKITFKIIGIDNIINCITPICCSFCKKLKNKEIKFYRCSACKVVYYCSAECQKQHWTITHYVTCKKNIKYCIEKYREIEKLKNNIDI